MFLSIILIIGLIFSIIVFFFDWFTGKRLYRATIKPKIKLKNRPDE